MEELQVETVVSLLELWRGQHHNCSFTYLALSIQVGLWPKASGIFLSSYLFSAVVPGHQYCGYNYSQIVHVCVQ